MRPECIEAVGQAIGRSITQREAEDIEADLSDVVEKLETLARSAP